MTTIDDAPHITPRSSPSNLFPPLTLLPIVLPFYFIMIDPEYFPSLTAPATTSSVAPIPTVLPGSEVFQELNDVGKRTLWYVLLLLQITARRI